VYWVSIFILPKKIIRAIEQKFNRFLWNGKDERIARVEVSWNMLCLPKEEGGLGIKKLEEWNRATMMRHIWSLFVRSGSLWVAWVHAILLKGRSFWQVRIPQICSWSWRKLLKLRDDARYIYIYIYIFFFLLVLERIYIFGLILGPRMGCFMRRASCHL
jgi:hypothetical protein